MKEICGKARKVLLESPNLEIFTPELAQAKAHVRECRQCTDFLQKHTAFRTFLKETLGTEKVPVTVRESIFQAIAQRQSPAQQDVQGKSRKIVRYWPAAMVLLLVLMAFGYFLFIHPLGSNTAKRGLSAELIDDHIRYRLSAQPVEITITEPQALTQWFSSQLDFGAKIPRISGFQLVGGRLCYLFDRRVALAFYQEKDLWVSLFVLHGEGIDLSGMEKTGHSGKVLCRGDGKGYQVVAWKEKDLLYALVSDQDVLELTKALNF